MDDGVGSMRLIVLAELAEGHQDRSAIEQRIRTIIVATCGIAPSSIALLPRGYLIKSTSGKLARAKSLEKFRQASHNEA
jgi:hypothetical protein